MRNAVKVMMVLMCAALITGCQGKVESEPIINTISETDTAQETNTASVTNTSSEISTIPVTNTMGEICALQKLPEYTPVNPESVEESAQSDFIYEKADDPDTVIITGYKGNGGEVKIPETLGGSKYFYIGEDAFRGNENITYLYIPDNGGAIGRFAFAECTGLEEVRLTANFELEGKGWGVFQGCTSLRRVEFGETLGKNPFIGKSAFEGCASLTEVVFPSKLEKIDDRAFFFCMHLERADLSNTELDYIGEEAFGDCLSLQAVSIPAMLQGVGDMWKGIRCNTFLNCTSLSDFQIASGNTYYEVEDGILYVDNMAFLRLQGYEKKDVVIRKGTTEICTGSFSYDERLTSVEIPDSVTEIGSSAFANCVNLKQVKLGNHVEVIGQSAFENCKSLEEITLPSSLERINGVAFFWCTSLKKVQVPDDIQCVDFDSEYEFSNSEQAVITYRGKEYTCKQIGDLNSAIYEAQHAQE
ncbi:leucine-rich repeat domain-containing protein [Lachnospiraceae bacterium 46-15]